MLKVLIRGFHVITSVCFFIARTLHVNNHIFTIPKLLMWVEQEQKVTEDARRYAEQDVATEVLQVNFWIILLQNYYSNMWFR